MNQQRYLSLDVFRGMTVAFMILVNTAGNGKYVYVPLEHARWHGSTPTDLVFPFFLFAVGNAMSFAMKKYEAMGNAAVLGKIFKRFAWIFGIGVLLNWFPFVRVDISGHYIVRGFHELRIMGVLQRIALCYLFGALIIHFFKARGAFVIACSLLFIYWFLLLAFGNPNDPYSMLGNAGYYLDKWILGENHMYHGEGVAFDPEGFLSTIPAVGNVIFGYLIGKFIQEKGRNYEMLSKLFVYASIFIVSALIWNMAFPINKKIWTSSYVLYTAGLATAFIALLIYVIEFQGKTRWSYFFEAFGKNPLFIYILSGAIVKCYFLIIMAPKKNFYAWFYEHGFQSWAGNYNGSVLFALFHVLLLWVIGYWMDKRKIYIRV